MPSTPSKAKLSGSTDGKAIQVTGTATGSSVTIHTAVSGTTNFDEIWVYAHNRHTAPVVLSLEWGATGTTDTIKQTINNDSGAYLCIPGWVLQNGMVVKAYAGTANVIGITGYVNNIT